MFKVFKIAVVNDVVVGNTLATKTKFSSYETARQWARKQIRQFNHRDTDLFWTSNPMIGDYGYLIRKV